MERPLKQQEVGAVRRARRLQFTVLETAEATVQTQTLSARLAKRGRPSHLSCERTFKETSDLQSGPPRSTKGVLFEYVSSEKTSFKCLQTRPQPEKVELFYEVPKVQDGKPKNRSKSGSKGRLAHQSGPLGRLFSRPHSERKPEVASVRMAWTDLPLHLPPLRVAGSTTHLHQSSQTCGPRTEKKRRKTHRLFGRYTHHSKDSSSKPKVHQLSEAGAQSSWILSKRQKIGRSTLPTPGVFRRSGGHPEHVFTGAPEKVKSLPQGSTTVPLKGPKKRKTYYQTARWTSRQTTVNVYGHGTGTSTFKRPLKEPKVRPLCWPKKWPNVDSQSLPKSSIIGRPPVVDWRSSSVEWEKFTTQSFPQDSVHGCLQHRLGRHRGQPQQRPHDPSDPGVLAPLRRTLVHQPKGNGSGQEVALRSYPTSKLEKLKCRSLCRQHNDSMVSQQSRWQIRPFSQSGSRNSYLLPQKGYYSGMQIRKYKGKFGGRSTFAVEKRSLRLAFEPPDFQKCRAKVGSTLGGLDRHSAQPPGGALLLLGTRRPSVIRRCPQKHEQLGERVLEPAVRDDWRCHQSGEESSGETYPRGPSVVSTALVARSVGSSNRFPLLPPPAGRFVSPPSGVDNGGASQQSSVSVGGTRVAGSRMETILHSFRQKGLSEKVIRTIREGAWKDGTVSQYQSHWSPWLAHCQRRGVPPLRPSVASFCCYLNSVFLTGASWSKVSTIASSLSTAIFLVSGYRLSSNPMVALVKRSIRSQRLPRAAYEDTWDVSLMFRYLHSLGPTAKLSRTCLLKKWVCLLKLDFLARSSDLARVFLSNLRMERHRLYVRIFKPKEWRAGNKFAAGSYSKWLWADSYPQDSRVCVVATAREVVKRFSKTKVALDLNIEGRQQHGVCTSVIQRPENHPFKGCYYSLSADRISAIFLEAMTLAGVPAAYKAHSSRSAAISAASVCGFTDSWILKKARLASQSVLDTYYRKPIRKGHRLSRIEGKVSLAVALRSGM